MAWYNPASWGGGPDQADWGPMRQIAQQIQQGGQRINQNIENIDFGITGADQEQWGKSFGYMRDMVMRDLQTKLPEILAQVSGQAGARGLAGSGIEAQMRTGAQTQAQRGAQDVMSQFGMQQAGQMAQFAGQRGQQELTRNQALWQNLLQSYEPMMNIEGSFLKSEMDRIAAEKGAFGKLLGGIGGIMAPGLGNLFQKIPGMGG